MKKYTSSALLALRLSWKTAAALTLLGALMQTVFLGWQLMPGGTPLQVNFNYATILGTTVQGLGMAGAAVLVLLLCLRSGATKGSKSVYTMRRLCISELDAMVVCGLVFTLYFLIYWAVQLGLCFAWFAWYTNFSLVSSNGLMLAVWDSDWFHFLLPMNEWLGYVRNGAICLSFGFGAAFGSCRHRRGKHIVGAFVPCVLTLMLYPSRVANNTDFALTLALLLVSAADYFLLRGGLRDEEAL